MTVAPMVRSMLGEASTSTGREFSINGGAVTGCVEPVTDA